MQRSKRGRRRLVALLTIGLLLAALGVGFKVAQRMQNARLMAEARERGLDAFATGDFPRTTENLSYYFISRKDDLEVNLAFAQAVLRQPVAGGRHVYEAIDLYSTYGLKLLDANPNFPDAAARRCEILQQLLVLYGQADLQFELRQTADAMLAIDPNDIQGLAAKAEMLLLSREHAEAIPLAAKLMDMEPDQINWRRLHLELMERQGDSDEQILRQCREWADQYQGDGRFHLLTAQRLVDMGRIDEAAAELDRMVARGARNQETLDRATVLLDVLRMGPQAEMLVAATKAAYPKEPWVREVAVRRFWRGNWLTEALDEIESARRDLGSVSDALVRLKALSLLGLGKRDESRDALKPLLSDAGKSTVDDSQLWAGAVVAVMDVDSARLGVARDELRRAIAAMPRDPVLHFLLGDVFARSAEMSLALIEYRQAHELDPNWMAAGVAYADALLMVGRLDEAYSISRAVFTRFADDRIGPFLLYARSYLSWREALGGTGVGADVSSEIIDMLERIHEQLPQQAEVAVLLTKAYVHANQTESALQFLTRVKADATEPAEALIELAQVSRRYRLGLELSLIEAAEARGASPIEAAFARAEWLASNSRGSEGLAAINQAISQTKPEGELAMRAAEARTEFMLALKHADAVESLRQIAVNYPNSIEAQEFVLGQSATWQNPEVAQLATSNLTVLLGPQSHQVRLAKAAGLLASGRSVGAKRAEAVVLINDVLNETPDSLAALSLMAQAMLAGQPPNTARAIECLERAVGLYPAEAAMVVRLIGLLQESGEFDRAGRHLRSLANLSASSPQFTAAELRLLQAQGDFESALARASALVDETSAPPDQLVLAAIHQQAGEKEQAERIYERLLADPSPPIMVITQAAEFYARTGRFDKGLALLEGIDPSALTLDRDLLLGSFHQRHQHVEEAGKLLTRAVLNHPQSLEARLELARHCLAAGRRDEARVQALEGLKVDPNHSGLRSVVAVVDLNSSDQKVGARQDAIKLLKDLGSEDDSLVAVLELLQQVPVVDGKSTPTSGNLREAQRLLDTNARAAAFLPSWLLCITLNVEAGRTNDAIGVARRAVSRFPGQVEPSQWATQLLVGERQWGEALVEANEWRRRSLGDSLPVDVIIAGILLELRRHDDAVNQLRPHQPQIEREAEQFPDRLATWIRCLAMSGDMDQATTLVTPLLARDAHWRSGWSDVAISLNHRDAIRGLTLLETHTTEPGELLGLATQWISLGRRSADATCYARADSAAKRAGEKPEFASNAMLFQGTVAEATGDVGSAESLYRQVLHREPGHAIAQNNLAYVLSSRPDQCDEALTLINAALKSDPEQPDFLDTLARVLVCLNRVAEAEPALVKAASARPDDLNIALHLADVRYRLNRFDDARELLDEIERMSRFNGPLDADQNARLEALQLKVDQARAGAGGAS